MSEDLSALMEAVGVAYGLWAVGRDGVEISLAFLGRKFFYFLSNVTMDTCASAVFCLHLFLCGQMLRNQF